jgi:hypothetical protein
MDISKATNDGQIRGPANGTGDSFEVRVAGSNGTSQRSLVPFSSTIANESQLTTNSFRRAKTVL